MIFWVSQNSKTGEMPGLINKENRSALPLSVSDITSCVRGYTLAMTASLTYENIEDHAIEGEEKCLEFCWLLVRLLSVSLTFPLLSGIFIYPLEENSIVVGFESMISSQIITLQIKDKSKIEDCLLDCRSSSDGVLQGANGKSFPDECGGAALVQLTFSLSQDTS